MKYQQPNQIFENLDRPKLSFSGFDLSHRHTTTFDLGQVIPIGLLEVIPNDRWDLGASTVLRFQPMVAPILHPVKLKIQAWFIPNRLLMSAAAGAGSWEEFITGGEDGTTVAALPLFDAAIYPSPSGAADKGSLWDRFGCNPLFDASATNVADQVKPIVFPWRAYSKLWNDWFRVPGIQSEIDIFGTGIFVRPFYENWPRDYFTSALPFLQRGVSPSLPVLGNLTGTFAIPGVDKSVWNPDDVSVWVYGGGADNHLGFAAGAPGELANATANFNQALTDGNTISANLSTVDTKQIRLAFLYQAFLERMARGGARYAEMLPNIWGARPLDERLNRVGLS